MNFSNSGSSVIESRCMALSLRRLPSPSGTASGCVSGGVTSGWYGIFIVCFVSMELRPGKGQVQFPCHLARQPQVHTALILYVMFNEKTKPQAERRLWQKDGWMDAPSGLA